MKNWKVSNINNTITQTLYIDLLQRLYFTINDGMVVTLRKFNITFLLFAVRSFFVVIFYLVIDVVPLV